MDGIYTYRVAREGVAALRTEVEKRVAAHGDSGAKVAKVELYLAQGHEHYHRRKYQEALTAYLRAEGLMYSFLDPRFDPITTVGEDVSLPVDPELFDPLAETVLATLRMQPDPPREVVPGPSEAFTIPPELEAYAEISLDPVVLPTRLDDDVITLVRDGTQAVRDGNFENAVVLLEEALTVVPEENPVLRAELAHDLGLALAAAGRPADAITLVEEARTLFADIGDEAAVLLVDDTVLTLTGTPEAAAESAARLIRAGTVGGLATAAAGIDGETRVLRLATGVNAAGLPQTVAIPLGANAHKTLQKEVYKKRLKAKVPAELGVGVGIWPLPGFFAANIPQHYFFTVQLCLGDCYRQLGQYEPAVARYVRARGYKFLNQAIEAPVVWTRIGECLVEWGLDLYRSNKVEEALTQFARVVVVAEDDGARSVPKGSPLYDHPVFDLITAAVPECLANPELDPPAPLTPDMAVILQRAAIYQDMLFAGLNAIGIQRDLVPVFRFRYLQTVARYFAEQAIKAEREYMSFLNNSEQETAGQLQLRQAVDLAEATVALENRRLDEARAELEVAERSRALARLRAENAEERRDEYAKVSADRVALDTASAFASGGFSQTEGGYRVRLSTGGGTVDLGDEDYEIMRNAAWHRGTVQREFELDDMARTAEEYRAHASLAEDQVVVSSARVGVARGNQNVARLRKQQAQQLLDLSQSKTFDAQLWHALAERMRELSRIYLDRAIEVAFLMQAAYNFETDAGLEKISANYGTSAQLDGLLGGNALLADIDYFTYHQVTQTRSKEVPVKTVLSLAEFFPFALFQFRRTGVASFETTHDLFDMLYPGSYLHRIKTVEVIVEGVLPADGINGSFRNSGVSAFRTRNGEVKTRLQPQETMLLSAYSPRGDAMVFRPSEEMRGQFEDSGAVTAWTLTVPPATNDLRYQAISDVKVVMYHTAFHDPELEERVRGMFTGTGSWARSFSLRETRPDAFFQLLETGAASVALDRGDFPFQHTSPSVQRVALYAIADTGAPRAGLKVELSLGPARPVRVTTGADGTVSSGDGGDKALNAFVESDALMTWQVSLVDVELPVKGLRDLVIGLDYEFTVRTSALD